MSQDPIYFSFQLYLHRSLGSSFCCNSFLPPETGCICTTVCLTLMKLCEWHPLNVLLMTIPIIETDSSCVSYVCNVLHKHCWPLIFLITASYFHKNSWNSPKNILEILLLLFQILWLLKFQGVILIMNDGMISLNQSDDHPSLLNSYSLP